MRATKLDPYAVLGIRRGASERQMRHACLKLANRYHPDLRPDATTNEQMQRVNQAWEILSSPVRRASYDAQARSRRSAGVSYSSASRRTAPMSSASTTWNGTWASAPPAARAYPSARSRPYDVENGSGWQGALVTVAIALVAFVALFAGIVLLGGILPFPLAGIALLVLVRGIFGRFGESRT
jgi:curved DNA-binding protein CbpA